MALLTVADIFALLHEKAKSATITQVTNFLNGKVKKDIRAGLASTFPTDFIKNTEIDIDVSAETVYSLPADIYMKLSTKDSFGNRVEEGLLTSLDTDRNKVIFGSDASGDPIVTVDAGATFTKLIIKYEVAIGDVSKSDDVLPYPNHVAQAIKFILAEGVNYYYFGSRKKTVELAISDAAYSDLKDNIYKPTIIG